jgi:hypothetical protein
LPGRNPRHLGHYTKVWDGSEWLRGDDAIDYMISLSGDPASLIPAECLKVETKPVVIQMGPTVEPDQPKSGPGPISAPDELETVTLKGGAWGDATFKPPVSRPGDELAKAVTWPVLFKPHGWEFVGRGQWTTPDGRFGTYWKVRRPAKDHGHSGTIGFAGDWFHCFTDKTAFAQDETFSKFGVYTTLNCQGDYRLAAERLRALGLGASPNGPPGSSTQSAPKRRFITSRASDIPPKEIEWLAPGRIPLGMITLLTGDIKLGKSIVLIYHAACVSRGRSLHGETTTRAPGTVILLFGEDHLESVVVPRLIAADDDRTKIHIVTATGSAGKEVWPSLKDDLEALDYEIGLHGDTLLVGIDPVSAYLGGVDDYRASELRSVLLPLGKLAERHNVAMELVNHVGKAPTLNAKHRGLGSVAYGGSARSNLLFARDPDDPSGRRVFVADSGGNLGLPASTLAYTVVPSLTVEAAGVVC